MKESSRYETLRDFINAQPRTKTQGDIARELGISESALSSYLGGHRFPSRETALRLSRLTGVPLAALLGDGERATA